MKLEKTEMLALWKRRHFLEPLRADCRISRSDGTDLDTLAADDMRRWYLHMLAHAPAGQLAPEDVTSSTAIVRTSRGTALFPLPDNAVRPLAIKLDGWDAEALIVEAGSPEALRQTNAFARGGACRPVAVVNADRTVELFSLPLRSGTVKAAYILVVTDPGPSAYILDESGFATLGADPACGTVNPQSITII